MLVLGQTYKMIESSPLVLPALSFYTWGNWDRGSGVSLKVMEAFGGPSIRSQVLRLAAHASSPGITELIYH